MDSDEDLGAHIARILDEDSNPDALPSLFLRI